MKQSILILLVIAFLSPLSWAREPTAYISIYNVRKADTVEERYVQVSIQFDLTDLSAAELSTATFSSPLLNVIHVVPVNVRGSRGIFSLKLYFDNFEDINGEWGCLINNGQTANENLHFTIAGVGEESFPPFPGYPQLNYLSLYDDVFVPFGATGIGIGSSAGASGYTNSEHVTDGIIYTFPEGGPYYARANYSRELPSIPVFNADDEIVTIVQYPSTRSENRIDFMVAEEPHNFQLLLEKDGSSLKLSCTGMTTGLSYKLFESEDLSEWTVIEDFSSRSNAFLYEPDGQAPLRFYMMTQE